MALFNPVEKNMFISLFGIDVIENQELDVQFSKKLINRAIEKSGANIEAMFQDTKIDLDEVTRKRYVTLLTESTASTSIYPKQKYASFFISTCGTPNPINSLESIIYLFRPIKAEVRIFTSSSISSMIENINLDEDVFWKNFDDEKIPENYEMKSREKDVKGIYFDLISERHDLKRYILYENKKNKKLENPVEESMMVSLYDVDSKKLEYLRKTSNNKDKKQIPFSKKLLNLEQKLENVFFESNMGDVINKELKVFNSLKYPIILDNENQEDNSSLNGLSYLSSLENGIVAYHITPEHSYVSFFISGSGNPYLCLDPLINLFKPKKAEARIFTSSPIHNVDGISYNNSKAFLEKFQTEEIPKGYEIKAPELFTNEFYIEVNKRNYKKKLN
jgi:S-adenosylmethionine/arginine decarboxylase-like enzyme